jgi:hypothetical protein
MISQKELDRVKAAIISTHEVAVLLIVSLRFPSPSLSLYPYFPFLLHDQESF